MEEIYNIITIFAKELGEIATYLLIMWGIFQYKFNKKIHIYFIAFAVLLLTTVIMVKLNVEDNFIFASLIFEIIFMIVSFEGKNPRKIALYITAYINTATLYTLIVSILYFFIKIDNVWLINDIRGNILVSFLSNLILIFLIFLIRNQRKKIEEWIKNVPSYFFILLSIPIFFCDFLMLYLQNKDYFGKSNANMLVSLSVIVLAFFLICWSVVFITTNSSKKYHKAQNSLKTKYLEIQKSNYERILEKDTEIRKFRHDIIAHIACMQIYLKENKLESLKTYINEVKGEMDNIISDHLKSGNDVVDAILNHMESLAKKENINIKLEGELPNDLKISQFDLCTVIYNSLQNSIDACKNIKYIVEKEINISFKIYKEILYIDVDNPIDKSYNNKIAFKKTSKKDKLNHGFGIGNIKNVAEKYNGEVNFSSRNNKFSVNIILYDII